MALTLITGNNVELSSEIIKSLLTSVRGDKQGRQRPGMGGKGGYANGSHSQDAIGCLVCRRTIVQRIKNNFKKFLTPAPVVVIWQGRQRGDVLNVL